METTMNETTRRRILGLVFDMLVAESATVQDSMELGVDIITEACWRNDFQAKDIPAIVDIVSDTLRDSLTANLKTAKEVGS